MDKTEVTGIIDYEKVRKARRKLKCLFYVGTVGIVLCISALISLQSLQTSMNIEDDLGSISLTCAYTTSIIFSLFFSPSILRKLGANGALVIAEMCHMVYFLANYHPEMYTLIPGAIVSGVARSLFLPACTIAIGEMAATYWKCMPSKEQSIYFNRFFGQFHSIFGSVTIFGNLLSSLILYSTIGIADISNKDSPVEEPTAYINSSVAYDNQNKSQYEYCGVNDCQDPSVVSNNIEQYVPPDPAALYTLVSVAVFLGLIAILLHWFIYPGIGRFSHKLQTIEDTFAKQNLEMMSEPSPETSSTQFDFDEGSRNSTSKQEIYSIFENTDNEEHSAYTNAAFGGDSNNNPEKKNEMEKNSIHLDRSEREDTDTYEDKDIQSLADSITNKQEQTYWHTLKRTIRIFVKPHALLLSVMSLQYGMMVGFIAGDVTRAYASCVGGVETTGLFASTTGITNILGPLIYGKLVHYVGRNIFLLIASFIEILTLILCYLWVPDPNTIVAVFFIFLGFGAAASITRIVQLVVYSEHFPDCKHIALSSWNFWMKLGMALQYGLSTTMCVRDKLYMQTAALIVGLIFFGIAERSFQRKKEATKEAENTEWAVQTRL